MLTQFRSKRLILSSLLAVFSALGLTGAANQSVIGTIVSSSGATVSGIAVPGQGTLTSNDTLTTAKGGSAWVRVSPEISVGLSQNTSVRFSESAGQISALLSSGAVAARNTGDHAVVVETSNLKIEPAQGQSVYVVALLPNHTTVISARRGDVVVEEASSARKHLVAQGHYARISNAPSSESGQAGTGSGATAASGGILNSAPVLFAIGVGAGVGIGFGIAEGPLGLGPASPSAP